MFLERKYQNLNLDFRFFVGALVTHLRIKNVHRNFFIQSSIAILDQESDEPIILKKKIHLFNIDKPLRL